MPKVTSLDGRVFEIDEDTLLNSLVPEEKVRALGNIAPLPEAPPERDLPPPPGYRPPVQTGSPWVKVRRVDGNGYIIEIKPPPH